MRTLRRIIAAAFCASLLGVVAVGLTATRADAAPGCNCPMVWDPVICDNGQVYSNSCVARCHHARGCRPYGDIM